MSKKDDYFANMDSQIKKWDAEVDKVRIKSEQMGTEAHTRFAEQLKTMRATNGVSASFPEVHVWRMKDGRAIEFREYQGDEQREDRFWS